VMNELQLHSEPSVHRGVMVITRQSFCSCIHNMLRNADIQCCPALSAFVMCDTVAPGVSTPSCHFYKDK
jgi:hypothetical protein